MLYHFFLLPSLAFALPAIVSRQSGNSSGSPQFNYRDPTVPSELGNVTFPKGPFVPPVRGNNPRPSTNTSANALSGPFTPSGGNVIKEPKYITLSNFDEQSLQVGLQQEFLELDLFNKLLTLFSDQDFPDAGLTPEDRSLIQWMANQEIGHAVAVTNMLNPDRAGKVCEFQYPNFTSVQDALMFSQFVTRWGESGVLGFLPHMDSRPNAQILLQSITTESRQEMAIRQLLGLFPMPVWFESGVPQAFAWTLLQRYIKSCPENNPKIQFQIFPDLTIENQANALGGRAAVSTNRTLTAAGRTIQVSWEEAGRATGPNNSYTTNTTAGQPRYAAFVQQLNVTYVGLDNVDTNARAASIRQPGSQVYGPYSPAIVNETSFLVLTDANPFLTPYNLTLINKHVVAGPALYIAG
ncbi:hypothetical protein OIV83_002314 [Microbotryomycetes sp. JL201]|nr:hypothetical protein OIV83_002314 [Microbotryomycetes sp. JL201]